MQSPLTPEQSAQANDLLNSVRERLEQLSGSDPKLLHHLRRRIYIRLSHDERDSPTARRKLKDAKWKQQRGICALCPRELPEKETELDRLDPYGGYTQENTRLVHHECHRKDQASKGFA